MIKGGQGGGNTTTGLLFEGKTDLAEFLSQQRGYSIEDGVVCYRKRKVAQVFKKYGFYRFLESLGIDWSKIISKRLLPDDGVFVLVSKKLYIIESKYQQTAGSVDEKLQTCDFKRKQYQKLMTSAGIKVGYIYILNDWFRKPEYRDVLSYIIDMNCQYYFNYLPLSEIGLPVPRGDRKA